MRTLRTHRQFSSQAGRLKGLEQLENRNLLTVSLGNVHLASDTGSSSTDKITSVATLTGDATGNPPWNGSAKVEFDHNNDGVVDGDVTISNGTFSYNPVAADSALENWEGSLTIKYRTRELDGYGGTVSTGDWQNFNMTLDRKAPTSSGLSSVTVDENSADSTVNLHNAFADGVTADTSLTYSVVSNNNASLFDSISINSGTLTLNYKADTSGTALITIRATDQAGNTKDTNLGVTVNSVNTAPIITSFSVTSVGGGFFLFAGTVSDDCNMAGQPVYFYLSTSQFFETAVLTDSSFSVTEQVEESSFWVYAWTLDGEEVYSEYVYVEV